MKDVMISITGMQYADSGTDNQEAMQLLTDGKYCYKDGHGELSYIESEITGLVGTKTSFKFSPDGIVLSRDGMITSRMVFREGEQNNFLYDTPYGSMTIGLDTHRIYNNLNEHGGDVVIDYVLNFDHRVVGRNKFTIQVKEWAGGLNNGKSC